MILDLLSAGAAQGLVRALLTRFNVETGAEVRGLYSAVGEIRERFLAGDPCDVLVLTLPMLEALGNEGRIDKASVRAIGRVRTGVAVRAGEPAPPIDDAAALRAALLAADGIYVPDTERSTAGRHFVRVLESLGIADDVAPALRPFPNGATAMRELARSPGPDLLGCTQVTEIRYTEGVELVGLLPPEFELSTVYAAAVSAGTKDPTLAERLVALLTGAASQSVRIGGGFEPM